jgi:tyrosyl-tRNA synthetase
MQTFQMSAPMQIVDLLVATRFAPSKSQARQLIQQGGVKLNDETIAQTDALVPPSAGILSVGRRKFVRLVETT